MQRTLCLPKSTPSSSRWVARQARDPYVRQRNTPLTVKRAPAPAYRSRSSFKLLSLHAKHRLLKPSSDFDPAKIVVDLGAAPGGWSQVASHLLGERGKVFAVDILDMPEITGVDILKGDFLDQKVQDALRERVKAFRPPRFGLDGTSESRYVDLEGSGMLDLVMSDMMAPMSGVRIRDIQASLDLVAAATSFAIRTLKGAGDEGVKEIRGIKRYPGGNLVLKFFAHPDLDEFKKEQLVPRFHKILTEKPKESRKESSEAYWVCLGYKGERRLQQEQTM